MSGHVSGLHRRKGGAKSKSAKANETDVTVGAITSVSTGHEIHDKLHTLRENYLNNVKGKSNTPPAASNSNGIAAMLNCCRNINCSLNSIARLPCNRNNCDANKPNLNLSCSSSSASASASACPSNREALDGSRLSRERSCSVRPDEEDDSKIYRRDELHRSSRDSGVYLNNDERSRDNLIGTSPPSPPLDIDLSVRINIDVISWMLFGIALATRFYKLTMPPNIVFDELHYGKYISLYMRNIFFFDHHPPLGKQLIAGVVHLAGYDGNYTFSRIGAEYTANVPVFWMRFVPALCGSALAPAVYKLLLVMRLNRWSALLGGVLIILDNALLTQSRFVLMESMLLLFSTFGICCLLKFQQSPLYGFSWFAYGLAASTSFSFASCIKYPGILTLLLAGYLMCRHLWNLLYDPEVSNMEIVLQSIGRFVVMVIWPLLIYVGVFYVHLQTLSKAGPHDSIMTSAFQASLEGGLASITRGQPLEVAHGSQITLRHTHGRLCWLHSHVHVYPVRYPDKRGSSHQQQVTCYSFKDVNNWWIVKRPEREDLVVGDEPDAIRDGEVIQLVHGITSRALNSHDVAAPITPQCQEVSCYIDYEIKMVPELLWRVEILNKETEGPVWHTIKSQVRLIHVSTGAALRFTGRQLPDWGFNQHEIAADRNIDQKDTIWNVEEHRYTKTQDKRQRELHLLNAEMIPTKKTKLTFMEKFIELQMKMLFYTRRLDGHTYSSEPIEWPLMDKGIAYWVGSSAKRQIHLLGNIVIWYTGTLALLIYFGLATFYVLRQRRHCYDLPPLERQRFALAGDTFFVGYLIHYLPYYFSDQTLFLHHYLPSFIFKLLMLCYVLDHIEYMVRYHFGQAHRWAVHAYRIGILVWLLTVAIVYMKFLPLSYGLQELTAEQLHALRWKDTWDFIV